MEKNSRSVQNAIQTFEEQAAFEMFQQLSTGLSSTEAIGHLRSCLTNNNESRVRPSDALRAADYAEKHGISTEDAFHAISIAKQAKLLRKSGMPPLEVLSCLTSRIGDQLESSSASRSEMDSSSSIPAGNVPTSPSNNVSCDSSGNFVLSHDSHSRIQSSIAQNPPSPPLPPQAPSYIQSPLIASNRSRTMTKKNVPVNDVGLKRSRSSDRPVMSVKEVENDVEIDLELGRLLTNLTGEINEAMRSGDRSKVAVLMRQRDQLRLSRGANVKTTPATEGLKDADIKRSRPSSRSS